MKDKKTKEKYADAQMEIVLIGTADVIATSTPDDNVSDDDWT